MNLIGRGVTPQLCAHNVNVNFGSHVVRRGWRGRRGVTVVPATTNLTNPSNSTKSTITTIGRKWQSTLPLRGRSCTYVSSSPHSLSSLHQSFDKWDKWGNQDGLLPASSAPSSLFPSSLPSSSLQSSPAISGSRPYSNLSTSRSYLQPRTSTHPSSRSLSSSLSSRYTLRAFPPALSLRSFSSTPKSSCSAIIPSSIMADRDILPPTVVPSHYDLSIRSLESNDWSFEGTVK